MVTGMFVKREGREERRGEERRGEERRGEERRGKERRGEEKEENMNVRIERGGGKDVGGKEGREGERVSCKK